MTSREQAAVQTWVEQLQRDGYATTRRRSDPVKAGLVLADPDMYFARCRAERDTERTLSPQDEPDGAP